MLHKYGIAGMMELADVPDSKSGGSDTVRVRPPLPAPKLLMASSIGSFFIPTRSGRLRRLLIFCDEKTQGGPLCISIIFRLRWEK